MGGANLVVEKNISKKIKIEQIWRRRFWPLKFGMNRKSPNWIALGAGPRQFLKSGSPLRPYLPPTENTAVDHLASCNHESLIHYLLINHKTENSLNTPTEWYWIATKSKKRSCDRVWGKRVDTASSVLNRFDSCNLDFNETIEKHFCSQQNVFFFVEKGIRFCWQMFFVLEAGVRLSVGLRVLGKPDGTARPFHPKM